MDSLISKKELLASTGISYGQLYRWKREGLIPEEWFNKQSSFTGQETFFPREEILSRVASILLMKDSHSLEELASILGSDDDRLVQAQSLRALGPVGELTFSALANADADADADANGHDRKGSDASFRLGSVALAYGICELAINGKITPEEARPLTKDSLGEILDVKVSGLTCSVFRAGDGLHSCLSNGPERVAFDRSVVVVARLPLGEIVNSIKARLQGETVCRI